MRASQIRAKAKQAVTDVQNALAGARKALQGVKNDDGARQVLENYEQLLKSVEKSLKDVPSRARAAEASDRAVNDMDQQLLAYATRVAHAALKAPFEGHGVENFLEVLNGAVAAGTIAAGFAYPILAAVIASAQTISSVALSLPAKPPAAKLSAPNKTGHYKLSVGSARPDIVRPRPRRNVRFSADQYRRNQRPMGAMHPPRRRALSAERSD